MINHHLATVTIKPANYTTLGGTIRKRTKLRAIAIPNLLLYEAGSLPLPSSVVVEPVT